MCECVCVCAAWVRLFAFDPHLDFDFRLPTHSRGIKDYFHQKQPTGRWRKTIKHRRRIRNENQWIDVIRRNNEYFNQLRCGVSNQLSNPIMHELSRLIKRLKCFDCFFFTHFLPLCCYCCCCLPTGLGDYSFRFPVTRIWISPLTDSVRSN